MTQSAAEQSPSGHAAEKKPSATSSSSASSRGGAVQLRAQLQGRDFAAQEEMLQPRPVQRKKKGADASAEKAEAVQLKAVQKDDAPGGAPVTPTTANAGTVAGGAPPVTTPATAPPISYTVPAVAEVGKIANPVSRNQTINQSYHSFDTAMTAYLGNPLVSNWCTYGQHASREAGAQIRNLQAAKQLISDIGAHLSDFQSVVLSASTPWGFIDAIRSAWSIARRAWNDVKVILGLLGEEGLVKQSILLWMARAGISQSELTSIESRFSTIASMDISDVGFSTAGDVYDILVDCINIGIRLATNIPGLISAMNLIYDNMVKGNREIYENVAPAYASFLNAGLGGTGVVGRMAFNKDDRGFLAAAFEKYSKVREKANALAVAAADDPNRGTLATERNALANQANLLVGYQEQLVILQPIFDTMQVELAAMSGTMVLRDPNGTHPLAGNWQNFYSRMGLDPAKTPPLSEINATNLGELAAAGKRHGSISEYFEQNLNNKKIHNAPSTITEHGS